MPGRLHLDEEFMVEENLYADIQKKAPSASEGATSNNKPVQASSLMSGKESKMKVQTTKMGPLTFDANPQIEEDEHVYLAAVDNQAEIMCWHYRLDHLSFLLNGKIP
jgi:hypothetical protein